MTLIIAQLTDLLVLSGLPLNEGLRKVQRQVKQELLKRCKGNKSEAARLAKVHRNTFTYRSKWE